MFSLRSLFFEFSNSSTSSSGRRFPANRPTDRSIFEAPKDNRRRRRGTNSFINFAKFEARIRDREKNNLSRVIEARLSTSQLFELSKSTVVRHYLFIHYILTGGRLYTHRTSDTAEIVESHLNTSKCFLSFFFVIKVQSGTHR